MFILAMTFKLANNLTAQKQNKIGVATPGNFPFSKKR